MDETSKKRRNLKKEYVQAFKSKSGCVLCGYNEHPCALDLDHIDPNTKKPARNSRKPKGIEWDRMSWKRLEEELAKCQVLCANCHRLKTHFEFDYVK